MTPFSFSEKTAKYYGVFAGLVLAFLFAYGAHALTSYPPAALLNPGDITTTHIRDATIQDIDVSSTSPISLFKIGRVASGTIPFFDINGGRASTSALYWDPFNQILAIASSSPTSNGSTSQAVFNVGTTTVGNLRATSTVEFRGVTYLFPTAQGTASTFLQNNGSGVLTWATAGGWQRVGTVMNQITTTDQVAIGSSTPSTGNVFSLDYTGTNKPLVVMNSGSSTPVFTLQSGTTTIDGPRTLFNQSVVKLKMSADQTLSNAATSTINWGAEQIDTDNMHSDTVNNTRITAPVDGYYQINLDLGFSGSADTSNYQVGIFKNGTTLITAVDMTGVTGSNLQNMLEVISSVEHLNKNDYIEATMRQSNAAGTPVARAQSSTFSAALIGK